MKKSKYVEEMLSEVCVKKLSTICYWLTSGLSGISSVARKLADKN